MKCLVLDMSLFLPVLVKLGIVTES